MKALYTMANRIGRFAYPLYFYPNQLKTKLLTKREATRVTYIWYPESFSPYGNA